MCDLLQPKNSLLETHNLECQPFSTGLLCWSDLNFAEISVRLRVASEDDRNEDEGNSNSKSNKIKFKIKNKIKIKANQYYLLRCRELFDELQASLQRVRHTWRRARQARRETHRHASSCLDRHVRQAHIRPPIVALQSRQLRPFVRATPWRRSTLLSTLTLISISVWNRSFVLLVCCCVVVGASCSVLSWMGREPAFERTASAELWRGSAKKWNPSPTMSGDRCNVPNTFDRCCLKSVM